MPEGDTIHRAARRIEGALGGRVIDRAEAPDPRSPLHSRAGDLTGLTLEGAEAIGKNLLLHFSAGMTVQSHLGMNGRWLVGGADGGPRGRPWLLLVAGTDFAAQRGGRTLRLAGTAKIRNDPGLTTLGPDPLRPGFDPERATRLLLDHGPGAHVGEALLHQSVVAGSGNAIRVGALFRAGISPWRRIGELSADEARALVDATAAIMHESIERGRRPRSIYGALRRPCPRCGGRIRSDRQGDDARVTYWCEGCQR